MTSTLRTGHNCWRIEQASRVALLVDGEAYFQAVRACLLRARRQVVILGWDFDGRIDLVKHDPGDGAPVTLFELLNHCVRERADLHVHVLLWDFAVLYALEREPLPSYRLRRNSHERVHVAFDDGVPFGASHHQKLVVVDDQVAFTGGLDLADSRWDTPQHRPGDRRRRLVSGRSYGPFHDVQMLLEGPAAAALGDLARTRWHAATAQRLPVPARDDGAAWPDGVDGELSAVPVAIARTLPRGGTLDAVCEVQQLYLDAIAAAQRIIYIENQYFTSERLGRALAERLAQDDGPEVVLVMPRSCAGWLEEGTMGVLRGRFLRRLFDADAHGRLGAFAPVVGKDEDIMVHAKVCVVDHRLCLISSSNFTKRSMGVDSECDVALEAGAHEEHTQRFIASVRARLLGEHLGLDAPALDAAVRRHGSYLEAIARNTGGERRLLPVACDTPARPGLEAVVEAVGDPPSPLDTADLVEEFRDTVHAYRARISGASGLVALAAMVIALALTWRYAPFAQELDVDSAQRWLSSIRSSSTLPPVLLAAYVVAGLVSMPITVMNAATVIALGPWIGFAYAMAGSLASACVCFFVGRALGAQVIRRFSSGMVHRVANAIRDRGFMAVLTVRMVPVAPFTLINLVAGALPVSFRHFVLGTVVGMAPGTVVLAAFGDRVEKVLADPGIGNLLLLGLIVLAWVGMGAAMHKLVEVSRRRFGRGAPARGDVAAGDGASR